jgi:S-adenosylmethionine decarboxylase proenzyme
MFQEYNSSGKHMICDFKGIQNLDLLNNLDELKNVLREVCKNNDFNILNESEHKFYPIGLSILFLLSESHLSVHTFPEKNHMSFDIYTCRQYSDNAVYMEIFNFLSNKLQASLDSKYKIIDRYF